MHVAPPQVQFVVTISGKWHIKATDGAVKVRCCMLACEAAEQEACGE